MVRARFRKDLLQWYGLGKRDLPWRVSSDPFRVWVSEVMLQQTRVAAVIPFYERFLQRFPTVQALAAAPEPELLAAWAGLGYYSRARNLQKAARQIVDLGGFPNAYASLRALPGVGDYTAAAIASIAFGLPHAAVDGNVIRVLSRLAVEPDAAAVRLLANGLLDTRHPGDYNQALMELGATVCVPAQPQCPLCPVAGHCEARAQGRQAEFPLKKPRLHRADVAQTVLLIERDGSLLFWQRPPGSRRMPGFWDLPLAEQLPSIPVGPVLAAFDHTIVNTRYRFEVASASLRKTPAGFLWLTPEQQRELPLSTTAKKALKRLPLKRAPRTI